MLTVYGILIKEVFSILHCCKHTVCLSEIDFVKQKHTKLYSKYTMMRVCSGSDADEYWKNLQASLYLHCSIKVEYRFLNKYNGR